MPLHLHNTLSRRKEAFEPLDPACVRMYVCGPTVYDYAHIGNARPVVVFDVLYRLLKRLYPRVTYVRNITDVDDKIINAHKETGEPIEAITARTAAAFHDDMAALGALEPDHEPRATAHIAEMIAMIRDLIDGGFAYAAEGHVLFSVPSWPDYGRLSGHGRDELIAGARVEVAPYKRDPADFVLWKPSAVEQPGWGSPWGRGRPGWHIECSAMSTRYLGETFDIHGGGLDLIFPHHENEIAQSTCAHGGRPFVRYWVHNGYVMAEDEKMSKSLGNFYTVHDLLEMVPGEAIRLVLLQTHYRAPLNFTRDAIRQADQTLSRAYGTLDKHARVPVADQEDVPEEIMQALGDDLNTPLALSHMLALVGALNRASDEQERLAAKTRLVAAARLLGLLQDDPKTYRQRRRDDAALDPADLRDAASDAEVAVAPRLSDQRIEQLIGERAAARKAKDFATADAIREKLASNGVVLEDAATRTTWRRGSA